MRVLLLALIPSLALASTLPAQVTPVPTTGAVEELKARAEQAQLLMNPAAVALAHAAALGLTDTQIAEIRPHAEQMQKAVQETLEVKPSPVLMRAAQAVSDPTISITEAELRAEYCARASSQAAFAMAMLRTQRAVRTVLTPEQRVRLSDLELSSRLQLITGKPTESPKP